MTTNRKVNALAKRVLELKKQIKTADEAMCLNLGALKKALFDHMSVHATVDGKLYKLTDLFAEGDNTWRPARIHRYSLEEVKEPKK